METLFFHVVDQSYQTHIFFMQLLGVNQLMCRDFFFTSITQVKCQCVIAIQVLVIELNRFFMDLKLISAIKNESVFSILDAIKCNFILFFAS
jgi:hypothetical protein